MAKVIPEPNYPSALLKPYKAAMREARQIRGGWYTIKRNHFTCLKRRGLKIRGLGLIDAFNRTTKPQGQARRLWNACIDCWHQQPKTGGVPWGDEGVHNRTVWYDQALIEDMQAYRYFMKLTRAAVNQDTTPTWWARYPNASVVIKEDDPSLVGLNEGSPSCIAAGFSNRRYIIYKKPLGMSFFYFFEAGVYYPLWDIEDVDIIVSAIPLDPDVTPPTWNNFNAFVVDDQYEIKRWSRVSASNPSEWVYEFHKIQVPACKSLAIHIVAPPGGESNVCQLNTLGAGIDCVPSMSPFWTTDGDLPLSALEINPYF